MVTTEENRGLGHTTNKLSRLAEELDVLGRNLEWVIEEGEDEHHYGLDSSCSSTVVHLTKLLISFPRKKGLSESWRCCSQNLYEKAEPNTIRYGL